VKRLGARFGSCATESFPNAVWSWPKFQSALRAEGQCGSIEHTNARNASTGQLLSTGAGRVLSVRPVSDSSTLSQHCDSLARDTPQTSTSSSLSQATLSWRGVLARSQNGLVPIRALPGMVGGPPITVRYLMPTNLGLNGSCDWSADPRDHDETATALRY
jgi:hypothetical protein